MSSDLLKEFGSPDPVKCHPEAQGVLIAEDDDFGDFEDAPSQTKPVPVVADVVQRKQDLESGPQIIEGTTIPKTTDQIGPSTFSIHDRPSEVRGDFTESSVFFDAEQVITKNGSGPGQKWEPSHDFGEKKPMKVKLLPIDQPKAIVQTKKAVPQPIPDQYDFDQDDIWAPSVSTGRPLNPGKDAKLIAEPTSAQAAPIKPNLSGPPPTNVPPPSVLLPLVAIQYESFSLDIKKIVASRSTPSEVSNQSRVDHFQTAIAILRAGARILAGRKLRWKRDNLLSQSMKIGPAGGKASGMKLVGVDKAEIRREDQEAAEVLNIWRKQVGSLRATVSTLNAQHSGKDLKLPDISENMPVRLIRPNEGAVTAIKACFLCGIKRDERVAKVDVDVEDSFGEWWREHWGHVDCIVFWEKHESSLRQR